MGCWPLNLFLSHGWIPLSKGLIPLSKASGLPLPSHSAFWVRVCWTMAFAQPLHGPRSAFLCFTPSLDYTLNLQNSLHVSTQPQPTAEVWWVRWNPLKGRWRLPGFTHLYLHMQKRTESKESFWGWGSILKQQEEPETPPIEPIQIHSVTPSLELCSTNQKVGRGRNVCPEQERTVSGF